MSEPWSEEDLRIFRADVKKGTAPYDARWLATLDQARAERDEANETNERWGIELDAHSALVARLREALERAKDTIRVWHGITMELDEEEAWALYQESPEMKQINAALARPDAATVRGEQG